MELIYIKLTKEQIASLLIAAYIKLWDHEDHNNVYDDKHTRLLRETIKQLETKLDGYEKLY